MPDAAARPRILSIHAEPCWPAISGGRLRSAGIAEALATVADVHTLVLGNKSWEPAAPPPDGIGFARIGLESGNLWMAQGLMQPLAPRPDAGAMAALNAHVAEHAPDAILLDNITVSGVLPGLRQGAARLILSCHNVESDLLAENQRLAPARWLPGNIWRRALARMNARRQDIAALRGVDAVWTCSEGDRARYRALSGVDSSVIPNPIPDEAVFALPLDPARYRRGAIVFVGLLTYLPNVDAARTLARDIAPRLPPGTPVTLLGRRGARLAEELTGPEGFRIVPDPPDLSPHLSAAGFTMMPIRSGSGTRLKVLEAMAAGIVVIATEKAVEGLGLAPGEHYARAETPDAFAAAWRTFTQVPEVALEMATAARAFVADRYSGRVFRAAVLDALEKAMCRRP